jgi:hypothetical protein
MRQNRSPPAVFPVRLKRSGTASPIAQDRIAEMSKTAIGNLYFDYTIQTRKASCFKRVGALVVGGGMLRMLLLVFGIISYGQHNQAQSGTV